MAIDEDPHVANAYRCRCGERHPAGECIDADWQDEPTVAVPRLTDADLLQPERVP